MPKLKTKKAAAKRFKKTGTGQLKRMKAYKSHILTKKSAKRKRNLRKATMTDATNVKTMKKILPYLQDSGIDQEEAEMARVKGGLNAKKKHNRVLKLAKGYRGARSKQYRVAKQSVMRALASSYAGRKERKRQFRQLWIARINAAARMNGLSYSRFMYGLKQAGIEMNRKMLAEMAVNDVEGFAKLAETAKSKLV